MKNKALIAVFIALLVAAQTSWAEVTQFKREVDRTLFLPCVNDYVDLHWAAHVVITAIEKPDRNGGERVWMFTRSVTQHGYADYLGNRWSFRAHFIGTQHGSDESPDIDFHARDQNVLIADRNNQLGFNITLTTRWQIRIVDGVAEIFLIESSARCFPE